LLTPEEAAALLRVSAYTVKEHARKGVIPAVKIGSVWRFSESSLLEYLRGRCPDSWMASETLDAIRLRTKPGPVVALVRESRRDLESREAREIRSDSR
jgi:PTS system nitrogen regulatory IIA component